MGLSESKVNKISIEIVKGLKGSGLVEINDETSALKIIRGEIMQFLERDRIIDKEVREKIQSLKKNILEGSDEWKVLYKKYYEEAKSRRGW